MVDVVQRSKPHKRDIFRPEKPSHSMKHVTRSLLQDELDADECLKELENEFGDHDVIDDAMNPFAFDNWRSTPVELRKIVLVTCMTKNNPVLHENDLRIGKQPSKNNCLVTASFLQKLPLGTHLMN